MKLNTELQIIDSKTTEYDQIFWIDQLLKYFIESFQHIYGQIFMSHNFHNLLHLCEDVKKYGHLDSFSAFRFENYMTVIKTKLRKKGKPLQQVAIRYAEMEAVDHFSSSTPVSKNHLKRTHSRGPLSNEIENVSKQHKLIELKSFFIDCDTSKNNYFASK